MSSVVYGFVAEPHKNNHYLVSPATLEGSAITCHDLSGFVGSWKMKEGGVFFKNTSDGSLCNKTMQLANEYAEFKNKGGV